MGIGEFVVEEFAEVGVVGSDACFEEERGGDEVVMGGLGLGLG